MDKSYPVNVILRLIHSLVLPSILLCRRHPHRFVSMQREHIASLRITLYGLVLFQAVSECCNLRTAFSHVHVHPPKPRSRPCCCFGLTRILYGKGFCSLVKIGGIWSLSLLTIDTIFIAAFCSDDSIARRTLIRSGTQLALKTVDKGPSIPASVLGLATTT